MTKTMLERYEQMRRYCVRWGNLHPDDTAVCHKAIAKMPGTPSLMHAMAELLDDMALALRAVEPTTFGPICMNHDGYSGMSENCPACRSERTTSEPAL